MTSCDQCIGVVDIVRVIVFVLQDLTEKSIPKLTPLSVPFSLHQPMSDCQIPLTLYHMTCLLSGGL